MRVSGLVQMVSPWLFNYNFFMQYILFMHNVGAICIYSHPFVVI